MKKEDKLILPDIPVIHNQELKSAVSALANASNTYRQAFLQLAGGDMTKEEILEKHVDVLLLADQVIERRLEEFGLNELDKPGQNNTID